MFLKEAVAKPSQRITNHEDPPHTISKREDPTLYRLVTMFKDAKPKEKARFVRMALSYFKEKKRNR